MGARLIVQSGWNRVAKQTAHKKRQRNASGQRDLRRQHGSQRVVDAAQPHTGLGRDELFIAFGLVAVILAVYTQVVSHQFIILDDNRYIRENSMVNQGLTLTGIAWAFTTFHAANWHPLTWLSHMLDCQIFGLNAGSHLLVNALMHAVNCLLLFLFLRRVTGAKWRSAIVAALFALHPLHVESVAWAAERKDTLSTFFGLLSLLAYARYVETPSWKRYALVAVAWPRSHGEANACNVAFCFAFARLLAAAQVPVARRLGPKGLSERSCRWFARSCRFSVLPRLRWS